MGQPEPAEQDIDEVTTDELAPGHKLMQGQYRIESFIQSGGFGITYLARNSLDRKVIIKECFPGAFCRRSASSVRARSSSLVKEFSSIVRKFVDEAHTLAKVKHPNVVGVHQVFEENETAYMALDFVEGCDLLGVIEGEADRPEPKQIETILGKMLDAVSAIHGLGMLHRDISPDNIMLNSSLEPILIDFGAAREDVGLGSRKLSELRVVKDGYSPQEFYVAGAAQGPFSDLYALAATFYHLITGDLPVDSQKRLAAVASGDGDPYVPLVGRMPEYSEPFLKGIDQAMAILPKDRIESANHWLDLLRGTSTAEEVAIPAQLEDSKASASKLSSATGSTTKARLLSGIALVIPIIGAVYLLQGNDDIRAVEEATATLVTEPAETVAAAAPPVVPVPVPAQDAAPVQDLGALLNIPEAATEVEPPSPEAPEGTAGGTTEPGTLEQAVLPDNFVPSDIVPEQALDLSGILTPDLVETDAAIPALPAANSERDVADISFSESIAALENAQAEPASETELATADAQPDVLIERFDLPQVTSVWSVDFTGVLPASADEIYAVNGVPLDADTDVKMALYQMMEAPEGATLELSVLAGASETEATVQSVTVPVTHATSFPDGTRFEARVFDGAWSTVVTDVPAGSDFEIGDVVVGDLDSEITFDRRTSLPDILVRANTENLERLTLAIRRDGDLSVASMVVPR